MKKNYQRSANLLFFISCLFIFSISCKQDDENPTISSNPENTVTDIDGNIYHTVNIGSQVWMLENLKTTKYRDGSAITYINDSTDWKILSTEAFCWYNNDGTNKSVYGALYNFYVLLDSRGLCPLGWHVATDAEWTALTTFLGGDSVAGGKLKEAGLAHWSNPNTGADNSSSFTALPGGSRTDAGSFTSIGNNGYWWGTSGGVNNSAWYRIIHYATSYINGGNANKQFGFSVRCVKD